MRIFSCPHHIPAFIRPTGTAPSGMWMHGPTGKHDTAADETELPVPTPDR
ncbi:hypothetical protein [Komagataeibacter rhaeticus]